jgi:hypothetical protein
MLEQRDAVSELATLDANSAASCLDRRGPRENFRRVIRIFIRLLKHLIGGNERVRVSDFIHQERASGQVIRVGGVQKFFKKPASLFELAAFEEIHGVTGQKSAVFWKFFESAIDPRNG